MTYGLFEHIAQFDDGQRVAQRTAAAVAQKRVADRFGNFLKQAGDDPVELRARLTFIEDDVRQIVAEVAEEHEGDVERLQEAIDEHLRGDGVTDLDDELEEAPSAVGQKAAGGHKPGCECGFCKNKGKLPGSEKNDDSDNDSSEESDSDDDDKGESDDKPDFLDKDSAAHTADGYSAYEETGDPYALQGVTCKHCGSALPQMATGVNCPQCGAPTIDQGFQQGLDSIVGLGSLQKEALTAKDFVLLADAVSKAPGDPHALAQHFADYLATTNPAFDRDRFIAAATGNPASGRDQFQGEVPVTTEPQLPITTAAIHEADAPKDGGGAVKRESLPTGDDTALGGPSPKIDKKTWKPNALNDKGNLKPIDSEQSGSPHPTEKQDVNDGPDYKNDFLEQTDAVTDSQSLPSANDSGQSTDRNISQDGQGGTWHTTEGLADPVTSSVDPDINPLKEILESEFATDQKVKSAIQVFEAQEKE